LYLANCGDSFNEVQSKTKLTYDPCDLNKDNNMYNIDYIPIGATEDESMEARTFFSNLLSSELRLRGLPQNGNLEERRERLRAHLKVEQRIKLISDAVARGKEGAEAALILLSQAIPCIMHLENRVGEKLITILLAMGAERFQRTRGIKSLTRYATGIQHIVNTKVLGTLQRPKQWKVPLSDSGDKVNKVSFSNKKTRQFVDNMYVLIDFIFAAQEDAELKDIWYKMVQDYSEALVILRQQNEFTDDDIERFQSKIDDFFSAYVETSGASKEGITNYIHMLGSAHIKFYMKQHRNLYKFSQQGWESLNEKVKLSFFNHSQRGGNSGANGDESERFYLRSIFLSFQRELIWISGLAEQTFNS
jgi:hypothetical protein